MSEDEAVTRMILRAALAPLHTLLRVAACTTSQPVVLTSAVNSNTTTRDVENINSLLELAVIMAGDAHKCIRKKLRGGLLAGTKPAATNTGGALFTDSQQGARI